MGLLKQACTLGARGGQAGRSAVTAASLGEVKKGDTVKSLTHFTPTFAFPQSYFLASHFPMGGGPLCPDRVLHRTPALTLPFSPPASFGGLSLTPGPPSSGSSAPPLTGRGMQEQHWGTFGTQCRGHGEVWSEVMDLKNFFSLPLFLVGRGPTKSPERTLLSTS